MEKKKDLKSRKKEEVFRKNVENYFRRLQKKGAELYVDGEKVSPSTAADSTRAL